MTDLTPNHPAVEALARELAQLDAGDPWPSNDDLGGHHILGTRDDEYRFAMLEEAREVLNATLPHLDAEDLRDTPAGRALRAEGWRAALAQLDALAQSYDDKGDHLMAGDLRFVHGRIARHNPYRKADA